MIKTRQGGKLHGSTKVEDDARFVRIPHEWIQSAAWRSLSPRAVWALVMLMDRWRPRDTYTLPRAAVAWGCGWGPLRKALDELMAAGFIIRVERGGLYHKSDIYQLSDGWKKRSLVMTQDADQWRSQKKLASDGRFYVSEWTPVKPKHEYKQARLRGLKNQRRKRPERTIMTTADDGAPVNPNSENPETRQNTKTR